MKETLMKYIKYFSFLRKIYRMCGSIFLRFIGLFVKIDDSIILFNSFGGRKYDDSPKAIFEKMITDRRFSGYKFIWAFHNPEQYKVEGAKIIKTDTFTYFLTALKARCWITNSAIERGLDFKKKGTLYVNTWHGTTIKYMGKDEIGAQNAKKIRYSYDIQTAQSKYDADIFSRVFNIDINNFLICGLPRNDELMNCRDLDKSIIRKKIQIPSDKKVILYAPTFREYDRDDKLNCVFKSPIHFDKWKEKLGEDYVILLRCHYEVTRSFNDYVDNNFVIDVSNYHNLNDLMLASDALISDYSSIIFDYSILDRPIYTYTYDYDEYMKKRGMYFDIRECFPGGSVSEDKLIDLLLNINNYDYDCLKYFREKYVTAYGNATQQVIDKIYQKLS